LRDDELGWEMVQASYDPQNVEREVKNCRLYDAVVHPLLEYE
jgi:hypothetical protein